MITKIAIYFASKGKIHMQEGDIVLPVMMNPREEENEFQKGMCTAVMFIAEMLELTAEIHKGIDAKQAKEMPELLLIRLCEKIERQK